VVVTPGDNSLICAAAGHNMAEELSSESEADDSDSGDNGADMNEIQRTNAASSNIVTETSVPCEFEARGTREEPVNETGFVTEVIVYSDWRLKKRTNSWKKKMKVTHCKVAGQLNKKNVVTYALKKTIEMQTHGILQFHTAQENCDSLGAFVPQEFSVPVQFYDGWARRPKIGEMYGPKYMEEFRSEIAELYLLGEEDKKNKKSPAQMLEIITQKNPKEFCLPSENDIRAEINKLQTTKKKKDGSSNGRKQKTTDDVYVTFIKALAANQPNLLPSKALQLTMEHFPSESNPQRPSDLVIKSKFSYYKRCVKQKTNQNK
jgi:hypothetical protein